MSIRNYVDSASSLQALRQDSGILPKPYPHYNTFVPKKGQYAQVCDRITGITQDYEFNGSDWEPISDTEEI